MPPVSGPSESGTSITSRPPELPASVPSAVNPASNFNATAAIVARNPPGLAYATTPPSGLISTFDPLEATRVPDSHAAAAIPRNGPHTLPTSAANRERTAAAVRHRGPISRVQLESPTSAASPILEINCAVWPFVVSTDYYTLLNATLTSSLSTTRNCSTKEHHCNPSLLNSDSVK